MRPGYTHVSELPWDEISSVFIQVLEMPDGRHWSTLVVDLTWGEFYEIADDSEGYADVVRELCRLPGRPVPEPATEAEIWPADE
ncbi:hypothetical protein [Actinoplanes utahensis]|uniref:Uncharacterized protein n=1 Tax=Actinoplanes utahensis TaxID=1869 RepID=A0A0A6UT96_ACTUT|nr:hypothetical protein [Actinoplanes utahensis]KHD78208.1 hypothetical protein MB27_07145 [Actinoplanes utahensis]GIF30729.1 hypothetical protein Aut01nite_37150 [Actinoplanes utahensis]